VHFLYINNIILNNSNFNNAINNNTKNIFYIKYIYLISKSKLYFSKIPIYISIALIDLKTKEMH